MNIQETQIYPHALYLPQDTLHRIVIDISVQTTIQKPLRTQTPALPRASAPSTPSQSESTETDPTEEDPQSFSQARFQWLTPTPISKDSTVGVISALLSPPSAAPSHLQSIIAQAPVKEDTAGTDAPPLLVSRPPLRWVRGVWSGRWRGQDAVKNHHKEELKHFSRPASMTFIFTAPGTEPVTLFTVTAGTGRIAFRPPGSPDGDGRLIVTSNLAVTYRVMMPDSLPNIAPFRTRKHKSFGLHGSRPRLHPLMPVSLRADTLLAGELHKLPSGAAMSATGRVTLVKARLRGEEALMEWSVGSNPGWSPFSSSGVTHWMGTSAVRTIDSTVEIPTPGVYPETLDPSQLFRAPFHIKIRAFKKPGVICAIGSSVIPFLGPGRTSLKIPLWVPRASEEERARVEFGFALVSKAPSPLDLSPGARLGLRGTSVGWVEVVCDISHVVGKGPSAPPVAKPTLAPILRDPSSKHTGKSLVKAFRSTARKTLLSRSVKISDTKKEESSSSDESGSSELN